MTTYITTKAACAATEELSTVLRSEIEELCRWRQQRGIREISPNAEVHSAPRSMAHIRAALDILCSMAVTSGEAEALIAHELACRSSMIEKQNRSALAELQGKLPVVTTASVMWIPEGEFLEYTSTVAQKLHDTQAQVELLRGENESLCNLVVTVRNLLAA